MRYAVLAISVCTGLNGFCQPPMPFPQGDAQWTVNLGFLGNSVPHRIYATMGDTLIDSDLYIKVGWVANTNTPFGPENLAYYGAIKDVGGQWLFVPAGDDATYLLYDFTGSVGDTVSIQVPDCGFAQMDFIVQAVEEVPLWGGTRRSWSMVPLTLGNQIDIWVEGMGSLPSGLFGHASCNQGVGQYLICFEEDGLLIHRESSADSCYYSLVGIEELGYGPTALLMYPNPASTWLQLEPVLRDMPPIVILELRDMTGRLVLRKGADTSSGTVLCDVSQVEQGTYLAALIDDSVTFATGKVIVAR